MSRSMSRCSHIADTLGAPRHRRHCRPFEARRHGSSTLRAATRTWADLLSIWQICNQPACRAQRRCRGDPLACLPHHLPAIPEPARLWFAAIGLALERNATFAEALAAAEDGGTQAACEHWHAVLTRALASPKRRVNEL